MDKKAIIGAGIFIIIIVGVLIITLSHSSSKDNELNYSNKTWLKIAVWGDDGYTVKKTDKHLYIHVEISSYDPSKIRGCPYAEVEVEGCGVYYKGNTDKNGNLYIPVNYSDAGKLTIRCKYQEYEKNITIKVGK
jgi:hypothetical protein